MAATQFFVTPSGNEVKLTIRGGSSALDEVHSALESAWDFNAHVPALIRTQIGIAVSEIAANILEHAHAVNFQIEVRVRPNEVEVEFTDNGEPAEIDLAAVCMPDKMAEHGRGLAMAKAVMRLVSYARDELGNHWRVVSKGFSG